jgi:carbon monoxide dehydrogenase subunit G
VLADGVDYEFTSRLGKDGKTEQIGRGSLRAKAVDSGSGTAVTWVDESQVGTFVERWFVWFGVLQEKAKEFQGASLQKLKQRLEAKPAAATETPNGAK